jgi:hypothetical protein
MFPGAWRGHADEIPGKGDACPLALASDSPIDQAKSLCAEASQAAGRAGLNAAAGNEGAFVAEVWTAVAVRLASGRCRNGGWLDRQQ